MRKPSLCRWITAVGLLGLSLGTVPALAHDDGSHHVHDLNFGTVRLLSDRIEFSNARAVPIQLIDQFQDSEGSTVIRYRVAGQPATGLCDNGEAVRYITALRSVWDGNLTIDFYSQNQLPNPNSQNAMSEKQLIASAPCNVITP